VSTDLSLSSMYGSMMSVKMGMKQRWERSSAMRMGCVG